MRFGNRVDRLESRTLFSGSSPALQAPTTTDPSVYGPAVIVAPLQQANPQHNKTGVRPPKSPQANVRIVQKGIITGYVAGSEIDIQVTQGIDHGKTLNLSIPQGTWPNLGSVFFEAIFEPPPGYSKDFPVHSPMNPASVEVGRNVWFAEEGLSRKTLELYQIAVNIPTDTPAEFNAVDRNSVLLRRSRNQTQIARDYQCRLIEFPTGSGQYPDDPILLDQYVPASSIFPDRLSVAAPPPHHHGYGRGLKTSTFFDS